MLIDYHVHSEFSDDSWHEMEQLILDAIEKNIKEILKVLKVFLDYVFHIFSRIIV